jgi:hypothetical protein
MITIMIALLLALNLHSYAETCSERTDALHSEIAAYNSPNLTAETHPTFYEMVQQLVTKAQVPMPRYITTFNAEYAVVSPDTGVIYREVHDLNAYVTILGDLYICRELVLDLSYEEIEGVVALALAEKKMGKPTKLACIAAGTVAATVASLYCLNKQYEWRLGSLFFGDDYYHRRGNGAEVLMGLCIVPPIITTKIFANHMQRQIDINAAQITDARHVIDAIKGICKVTDAYVQEGLLSRIADRLHLKRVWNTVFYPIRAFTPEERIAYLEQLSTI